MKKIYITIALLLIGNFLFATNEMSAKLTGSSWSHGMLLRGLDAVGYNPALLGFSDNKSHYISLFPVNASLHNNSISKSLYDDYFAETGDNSWSNSDINDILSRIEDDSRIGGSAKVGLIGFSLGHEAYTLNNYTISQLSLPKALFSLVLKGNELNKSYDVSDIDGEYINMASAEYTFAEEVHFFGVDKIFKEFTIGATFRYMFGFPELTTDSFNTADTTLVGKMQEIHPAYVKITNVTGTLSTDENSASGATKMTGQADILVSEAGHGIGVDIGVAAKLNDNMSFGLSVSNLVSGLSWYHNNKIYRYDYQINGILPHDLQEDEPADSIYTSQMHTTIKDTIETNKFFTSLPCELNAAFAWKFDLKSQYIIWTAAYNQGFKYGQASTIMPKISTGIEWSHSAANWLKLRAGLSGGGEELFNQAVGFGLEFSHYSLDFGIENRYLLGSNFKGIAVSLGQSFYW